MGTRSNEQYTLLTDYDTNTAYSEAFHTLYANIRFNWKSDNAWESHPTQVHTLLLTAPTVHDEQAALAANLAIVAARSGTPTILVDADLRTPGLQQRFDVAKSAGLSDLLESQEPTTVEKIGAYLQKTFVPGLRLLGAGTSTAQGATLLLSPKLEAVIENIREVLVPETAESRPGFVIFHSAPVSSGADASLLGALVEQTLLTIVTGHTTRAQATQAQEQLQRAHTRLVGIVMLNP